MSENRCMIFNPTQQPRVSFMAAGGKTVLIIETDGRLVRGDDFRSDDEASVALFDVMARLFPSLANDLLRRAEQAERKLQELEAKIQK